MLRVHSPRPELYSKIFPRTVPLMNEAPVSVYKVYMQLVD